MQQVFSEMDQMIIRNSMLSKSYNQIAELLNCDAKTVGAFISSMIAGTAIVTKQMIIDQKKISAYKKPAAKRKPISDEKIKEEWSKQKEQKTVNSIHHQAFEKKKVTDAWLARKSFKTIKIDTSKLLAVKIDNKTTIFINHGEDAAAAKEKFFKNRIREK